MRRVALALVAAGSACSTVLGLDPGEPRDGTLLEAGADGTRSDAESGETAPGDDGAPPPDGQLPRDAGVEASADVAPPPPPPRKEPQIECGDASCVPAVTKCVLSCGSGVQLNCQPWQAPLGGCAIGLCDDTADCPSA